MTIRGALVLLCALLALPASARGADFGKEGDLAYVHIHAFASQGAILTTGNDYLVQDSKHVSFQMSEVGINVTKNLTDKMRMGLQLFAQDFGPAGNYTAKMDWFYLDYRHADWLGFRAGHLKMPFGLFNEINDIDSARVPILLPQSVYPLQSRQFLFAQTGAEVYGFARSREGGALEYRLYGGTLYFDASSLVPFGSPVQLQINVPYVFGGRILWETPLEGLRVGGSAMAIHYDAKAFVGTTSGFIHNQSLLWIGSADYSRGNVTLTAEYSRWFSRQESTEFPTSALSSLSERVYAMATYRAASWLQPGAYYSLLFPDVHNRDGRAQRQHDLAATVRFDINSNWLVKLEGHWMAGTAGLTNPLNVDPVSTATADQYWGVFLVKTTAYF